MAGLCLSSHSECKIDFLTRLIKEIDFDFATNYLLRMAAMELDHQHRLSGLFFYYSTPPFKRQVYLI